jgi:hypothetical protein
MAFVIHSKMTKARRFSTTRMLQRISINDARAHQDLKKAW